MTTVHLPCDSCGDIVTASREHLSPVTLCGACTPEEYADLLLALDEAAPEPLGPLTLPGLLASPVMPTRDPLADLEHRLPNVAMEREEAMALRGRIRREAAA